MPRAVTDRSGFTLLEVLVAFAILSIAVVSLIELTSQGLRLLRFSGEHQQAVQLADRLAMGTQVNPDDVQPDAPVIDAGEEGFFAWERRIAKVTLPDEIESRATIPGKEVPGLYTVSVAVRWGRNQAVEVATLRAPSPPGAQPPTTDTTDQNQGQNPGQNQGQGQTGNQTSGQPGSPNTRSSTSSSGGSSSTGSGSSSSSRTGTGSTR